jgi:hypothetical protein
MEQVGRRDVVVILPALLHSAAPSRDLHMTVRHGWSTLRWVSSARELGYNVYSHGKRLNRSLIESRSMHYTVTVRGVVRHPVLRSVPLH